MIGSAAELFAACPLKIGIAEVRGQQISAIEMTQMAREEIYGAMRSAPLKANALCVLHCAADKSGKRLFGPGDLDRIQTELPTEVIDAIASKVMELAGLDKKEEGKAPKV